MKQTVLILGASGKVGCHTARAFAKAGWVVRKYDRAAGDMIAQAQGAQLMVNGLNPPNYHNWAEIVPQITQQVIAAAKATGATVILPGNVYNFGAEPGPWASTTPQRPTSRKGQIRVEMEAAYRRSGVRTIVLRAGNFLDPDRNADIGQLVLFRALKAGKLSFPGRPDAMQAWCYLPDWADAAVRLAEKRDQLALFEDVPFGTLNHSAEDIRLALEVMLARPIKLSGFPWSMMRLSSPFWEMARELLDMRYLWDLDHSLSAEKLHRLLPNFEATPLDQVLAACIAPDLHPNQTMARAIRV